MLAISTNAALLELGLTGNHNTAQHSIKVKPSQASMTDSPSKYNLNTSQNNGLISPLHSDSDLDQQRTSSPTSSDLDEDDDNIKPYYIIEWPRLTTGYGSPKLPRAIDLSEDRFRPQHFDSDGAFELLLILADKYKVKPIDVIIDEGDNFIVSVTSTTESGDSDYYFAGKRVLVFKQEFRYRTPVLEEIVEKACDLMLRAMAKVHRIHDLIHLPEERSPFYKNHGMNWIHAAYDMLYQLLRCLMIIHHKLGLVHGNISSSNVGWVASGDDITKIRPRWCLIDFTESKWAKNINDKLYFEGYTAEYAAPETHPDDLEQFDEENPGVLEQNADGEYIPMVCAKSEVYSVAAVVMGAFPIFEHKNVFSSKKEMQFVSDMQYCLCCMLNTKLEERYSTKAAFKLVEKVGAYYLKDVGLDKLKEHKISD
ncbi:hypothetical protein GQ42DRAFT_170362 [Ramicandelaber brevisporus]|nr:hypothetical protein GQ42DRAFT_170362 [Ramicandelaber brevisporus]